MVKERRDVWRLSLLPDMFVAFLNVLFLLYVIILRSLFLLLRYSLLSSFKTLFGGMEQKSKVTTLRGSTTSTYATKPNSGVPGNSRVNGFGGKNAPLFDSVPNLSFLKVLKINSPLAMLLEAWLVDEVKVACRA